MISQKIALFDKYEQLNKFFLDQGVNITPNLYNAFLEFLPKACKYAEEEIPIRPSIIIGSNLLCEGFIKLMQATVITLKKEEIGKTKFAKRLKSFLPFCNNSWRVFINIEDGYVTYGLIRNFNGPMGLNIDDILSNLSPEDKNRLNVSFVLIDVINDFQILLQGLSDSCLLDFRLVDSELSSNGTLNMFCQDILSASPYDKNKLSIAYMKILKLFQQKLHGSLCLIIDYESSLPDDIMKDGIILEEPIDIPKLLIEELNKNTFETPATTMSTHSKYHAFVGLLLDMLNIDGITVLDNMGRIRGYNFFVKSSLEDSENVTGGARSRAAEYLCREKKANYKGVYFQSQDGMNKYVRF